MGDLFPSAFQSAPAPLPTAHLQGQTVLVTGAGGTLGTALAHQLAALPLRRLILLDTSEHSLAGLRERLKATGLVSPLTCRLADLRVPADRHRALRQASSSGSTFTSGSAHTTVIHAAAYKRVPFLEGRPIAAVQNNLLATADWLSTCRSHDAVKRFVFVSTDKAVAPTSTMGATKAAAERIVRAAGTSEEPGLTCFTIRLCNVFGSRGSVVPRFCRRLQAGKDLPLTHPDMERRFLTARRAARSALHVLHHQGGTYLPQGGRTVSIERLARRLVRWARPAADPDDWIRYVGPRAGERLREPRLREREEASPVEEAGPVERDLLRVDSPAPAPEALAKQMSRLRRQCAALGSGAASDAASNAASNAAPDPGKVRDALWRAAGEAGDQAKPLDSGADRR